jgi:hypothetical protein
MKKYILIEIKDGSKTGNKIEMEEPQFQSLNIINYFKVYKSKEKIEVAIDHEKFKSIKI